MPLFHTPNRRRFFKAPVHMAGMSNPVEAVAAVAPKAPGETKIVAIMGGDLGHNAIPLEYHMRGIFAGKRNWRIVFALASRFFTPELIADADLLIVSRHSRPDDIDWRSDGFADAMAPGVSMWSDANAAAIIDNVRNRGMGFIAMHNTIFCGRNDILGLLGVEPVPHMEIQPLWVRDMNPSHSVSAGIDNFMINLDEQFAVVVKSEHTTTLFETAAMHDKRNAVGGWCLESGKGRVVGLLPGHMRWAYEAEPYREIVWRAAHWAMKRDIELYPARRS